MKRWIGLGVGVLAAALAACSSSSGVQPGEPDASAAPDVGVVEVADVGAAGLDASGAVADAGVEPAFAAMELLTRPTDVAVTVSVVPNRSLEIYFEYGTSPGTYSFTTPTVAGTPGTPLVASLDRLPAGSPGFYRMRWRSPGDARFQAGEEHRFQTRRPAGAAFTFTIQADSHLDDLSDADLYRRTLANVLADASDFHVDLGDTFMCEKHSAPFTNVIDPAKDAATVDRRYLGERAYFGLVAHSAPLFLVNGNHEGEAGWLFSQTGEDVARWATRARLRYYPPPLAGTFYSGSTTDEPFVGQRAGWYAWTWGDALFVVLDPFWYSATKNKTDGWVWTLGREQYDWLERTLRESKARFKFVFAHQLVGGLDGQGRGGVEAAGLYEWGGRNADGTEGFAVKRSGWGKPIHQLLVEHRVNAFFHGHDHLYARQELDGVVYQEVPQPSNRNYKSGPQLAASAHYASGTILGGSGHLRVKVTASEATVEYVQAFLPADSSAQRVNGAVADRYTLLPR